MNEIEAELYAKLCEFKLDDPTALYPMSVKLAWEYHWSEIYTLRAMCEYKKYIFLAAIAEGMVSPSSAIDCVWHYHLLYTYSYWEELCGKILKKSLHHYPGDSGASERYEYTIELYESYFGSPPADIWDFPPLHSNHLDQRRCYWQIPNPIYWVKKYLSLYLFHHSVGSKDETVNFSA
ncbi:MAG: hypothetical protein HLUCCA11_23735 [Phormidesmis priestleyi Ana]|uniref:Uncharacterized protein n=1 Tax=Phormidesmis priestleyi Ana TaxID=1666911 RepID=A0A0P7YNL5_9CYAN|nr:MAG: hypothetical protein HLUCCA11_23735 [Phormidesmis priestleyi Ana]